MKLEEYQKCWEEDAKIDSDDLGNESLKIPKLHSKYLSFFSSERNMRNKLISKRESEKLKLSDYFSGIIDGKDIGRAPWPLVKETKAGIEKRVESDDLIVKMQSVIDDKEEIILFLKEVIICLNQRNFQIKNAIDYLRWSSGG